MTRVCDLIGIRSLASRPAVTTTIDDLLNHRLAVPRDRGNFLVREVEVNVLRSLIAHK